MSTEKRWEPRDLPRVTSVLEAVALADVEHHERYQPGDGKTYCNIFVWDVTRAVLGPRFEAPHWVGPDNAPCPPFEGRELSANALCIWLAVVGPVLDWRHVSAVEAGIAARHGEVVLATWENPSGHGHVAVVLPGDGNLHIAQAGKTCFANGSLAKGFGSKPVSFFAHALPV